MDGVSWREYMDTRLEAVEQRLDSLAQLMRRELDLLAEDRERQRQALGEKLDEMNALRAQLDRQAGTLATRERVEMLERHVWRALGLLAGAVLVVQILFGTLLK